MQGATELAKGVKQAGGWPCLRRIDLRHNLLNSAVRLYIQIYTFI